MPQKCNKSYKCYKKYLKALSMQDGDLSEQVAGHLMSVLSQMH